MPGIGKRTAERIIVELREKVGIEQPAADSGRRGDHGPQGESPDPRVLAREGLLELGYAPAEVDELLRDAEGESAEDLIGQALRAARAPS